MLYEQHAPRLYAVLCRMSGSPEQAEDLLQDVFLQAHRKLDTFDGRAAVGTWLYRLAVNRYLDYARSRSGRMQQKTTSYADDLASEPRAQADSPAERIDLERAIQQLPDGYREAFVLHDVEGFEHREIARMLGIAEGTSKSQVFKARMKLRELLGGCR
jgi:RNA polymerase sigma-70 factor (ECF subfamily)